jgi:hypothetical protein
MRGHLRQWVDAGSWKGDAALTELRSSVESPVTVSEVRQWMKKQSTSGSIRCEIGMLTADVKSPIDVLNEQDSKNYASIRRVFPNDTRLADDVLAAYDYCAEALQPHLETLADRIANALLTGICRHHLIRGATALFRVHAAQMFRETRSAVETAGIAYVVRRDPAMLNTFLEDDGREEQRRAAKNAFRPGNIFPKTEEVMRSLRSQYDLAS